MVCDEVLIAKCIIDNIVCVYVCVDGYACMYEWI